MAAETTPRAGGRPVASPGSRSSDHLPSVLHVVEAALGGSGKSVLALAAGQAAAGQRVALVYSPVRADNAFRAALQGLANSGVILHSCPMSRGVNPWKDIRAALDIRAFVRSFRPEILHLHASKAGMLGRLLFGFGRSPRIVYQPHGFSFLRRGKLLSAVYRSIEVLSAPLTDACVATSVAEATAATAGPLAWPTPVIAIPNIVELPAVNRANAQHIRTAYAPAEGDRIALYLGRLEAGKLVEDLIRAIARLREQGHAWSAVIAGDGARASELSKLAAEAGVERHVHFLGFRTDGQDCIAAADCCVYPSSFESFGLSVAECMRAGKAVITTDIPTFRELLADDARHLCYPPGDVATLARMILNLDADGPLRTAIIGRLEERSRQYSSRAVIDKLNALYGRLLREAA